MGVPEVREAAWANRPAFARDIVLPGVAALGLSLAFFFGSHGGSLRVTFVPAMIVAYVCYLARTARRRLPDPAYVLPAYLLALATQFLHFAEEFATGFGQRWPTEIFGAAPYPDATFVAFNMASYAAFTIGGLALMRGYRAPLLLVWFFAVMGTLGNALSHVVWSTIADGYFPGLWTSLAYWVLGPVLVYRLWHGAPPPNQALQPTAGASYSA